MTPSTAAACGEENTARGLSRRAVVVVAVLVAAAVTSSAILMFQSGQTPAEAINQTTLATAPITRGDVVDTVSVGGRLAYTDKRGLPASADGVVTWTPAEGDIVTRGMPLLKVDNKPVVLLYGAVPFYRTLKPGMEGPDVKQLEDNLNALGHAAGFTVDSSYTSATANAVQQWQESVGLPRTGTVDASQAMFQPGEVRVSEVSLARGSRASAAMTALTVTGTSATVHVDLEAARQNLVTTDQEVSVRLPGGGTVAGRVRSVGTVAKTDQQGDSTIGVEITVSAQEAGRVDQLPVSVELVSERANNVLSVPIEALLGLREGGFGVEVVIDDVTTRIVAVETGVYGGGRVEITGPGLQEGTKVGVPAG